MSEKPVNVLVTSDIGEHNFRYVVNLSPRISVKDASLLVQAELQGDSSSKAELDAMLAEAEVILGAGSHDPGSDLPLNLIPRTPRLKWFHSVAAGVDSFLYPDHAAVTSNTAIRESSITVTNASGSHTAEMTELVIENMLQLAKRAPDRCQWKREKQWVEYSPALLRDKTVGILGMGYGREVARLAKAFGMKVIATRRSARPGDRMKNVDVLLPPDQLPRLLAESDYVVVLLPLTTETYQMLGEKELRAMKPTAFLINNSRGKIIDEPALIRALEEGWIAGAGLDVFEIEPLPPDSKLWSLPNVVYSPHVGGDPLGLWDKLTVQFGQNLLRYLEGKQLYNVINKLKGYQTSGPHFRDVS